MEDTKRIRAKFLKYVVCACVCGRCLTLAVVVCPIFGHLLDEMCLWLVP